MSELISSSQTLEVPYDKFWDAPPTRRELQKAFTKLGQNDSELMGMADTAALVLNYLCETLKVDRKDLDDYVARKAAEVKAMRAQMEAQNNGQPNG